MGQMIEAHQLTCKRKEAQESGDKRGGLPGVSSLSGEFEGGEGLDLWVCELGWIVMGRRVISCGGLMMVVRQ